MTARFDTGIKAHYKLYATTFLLSGDRASEQRLVNM